MRRFSDLIAANPIVATVDGLLAEISALNASGSPAIVAEMAPMLQGLIDSVTAGNPVIGQVADMRDQVAGLVTTAGPALSFFGPQQWIPDRLSRSLKLTQ